MSDTRLQEIVTKAVVGRAERRMTWSHTVPAEGITGVYGVHVTDSAVAIKESNGRPVVDVLADCDLWCGTSKHTKVIRCSCRGTEIMDVRTVGHVLGDLDLSAKLPGRVRATGVSVGDGGITLTLEADVVVEMSALSRLWVKAYDMDDEVLSDLEGSSDSSDSSSSRTASSSYTGSSGSASSSRSDSSSSGSSDYSGSDE